MNTLSSNPQCAIVIPAYNHATFLGDVIQQALGIGYPIFVVDDGSTDNAAEVVNRFSGVTLIQHPQNQGKGAALLSGFAAAAKLASWAITIDADGQHIPQDAHNLIAAIPTNSRPIIIGYRQGMNQINVPWTSRFGRIFSNLWVWAAGGVRLKDSQSGFRLYPLPEILNIKTQSRRFQYEVEILAVATWNQLPIIEVPIRVNYFSKDKRVSHFRPWVDFWRNSSAFARLIIIGFFTLTRWRWFRSSRLFQAKNKH